MNSTTLPIIFDELLSDYFESNDQTKLIILQKYIKENKIEVDLPDMSLGAACYIFNSYKQSYIEKRDLILDLKNAPEIDKAVNDWLIYLKSNNVIINQGCYVKSNIRGKVDEQIPDNIKFRYIILPHKKQRSYGIEPTRHKLLTYKEPFNYKNYRNSPYHDLRANNSYIYSEIEITIPDIIKQNLNIEMYKVLRKEVINYITTLERRE